MPPITRIVDHEPTHIEITSDLATLQRLFILEHDLHRFLREKCACAAMYQPNGFFALHSIGHDDYGVALGKSGYLTFDEMMAVAMSRHGVKLSEGI